MAISTHNTATRRDTLAALGATGLAGVAVIGFGTPERITTKAAHPDAALLSLAAAHAALERQRDHLAARWGNGSIMPTHIEADMDRLHDEAVALRGRIVHLRAKTPEGRAAKARLAADLVLAFPGDLNSTDRLVLSLCRDIEASA